jgi:hypothetical protein
MKEKPWIYQCDDITVVTLLQADSNIGVYDVETQEEEGKRAKNTHCIWHLLVRGYSEEEIDTLVESFHKFGGKCSVDERVFSYRCPDCGVEWVESGPCGDECADAFIGRAPDFHFFDAVKRQVITQKRHAQEELSEERGEGPIYA